MACDVEVTNAVINRKGSTLAEKAKDGKEEEA